MLTTEARTAPAAVTVREMTPDDADACARIVYEAFADIHDRHAFARDFPTPDAAAALVGAFVSHPRIWGVVAEAGGRIVGSSFLDERGPVVGIGPITVDPAAQARGVGRRLMEAVIERGAAADGVRLLQDAFNTASLALYASLGFTAREPVVVIGGRPAAAAPVAGLEVRPLEAADVPASERLHRAVHGFERTAELRDALATPGFEPVVALRDGEVVAYASTLTFFPAAHAVAESEDALWGLVAGALAATDRPASFLLPTRQAEVLRRCLAAGLRVVKPMTYMTLGDHPEPRGAWIPSVLY
ncbi:MAG TPA: GNAT family N-acetyltransferase [Solirubrobacteraceae bacterium]|nr:GNAT family N-acetyltransferase [Solirubrobacteraceae bacterium]